MELIEPFKGSPFFAEARNGLFIRNQGWKQVIEALPDKISANDLDFVSVDQLLAGGMQSTGMIGGEPVHTKPDFKAEDIGVEGTLHNTYLQWMRCYFIVEGICNAMRDRNLKDYPDAVKGSLENFLHTMVYAAAMIVLLEADEQVEFVSQPRSVYARECIRSQVRKISQTLYTKTADYGEGFRRHGITGMLPRVWDKVARYSQLSALGRDAHYEPKIDAARDLLGYCTIAWSLMHEPGVLSWVTAGS